ncbi:MAG: hypothetical protein IKO72_00415 [Kiritimatiellae bacterium]|nr:hypothetical protein [Kiritimatiellia bacterium]
MKTMVVIARALKEKNRVAGRLVRARELVGAENSKDKSVSRGVDVAAMYDLAKVLRNRLVAIKSAIAEANKPIVSKIIELDEIKSEISFLNGLDVKEGKFVTTNYGSRIESDIDAVIRKQQVLDEVAALQARADRIQDELDEFNATTNVEIEIDE